MANRLQKQPVLTYVPNVRAVPDRPAYCETIEYVSGFQQAEQSSYWISADSISFSGVASLPPGAQTITTSCFINGVPDTCISGWLVPSTGGSGYPGGSSRPIYSTKTICHPLIPGVPGVTGRVDSSANNGWNAGARSIAEVPVGGYFQASVGPSPNAVIIGLSAGEYIYDYSYPTHAIVVRPTGVTPIENGVDVGGEVSATGLIRLERGESSVTYYVGDQVIYKSETGIDGLAYGHAILYTVQDYLEDPVISTFFVSSGVSEIVLLSSLDQTPRGVSVFSMETDALAVLDGVMSSRGTSYMKIATGARTNITRVSSGISETALTSSIVGYGTFSSGGDYASGISYVSARVATVGAAGDKSVSKAAGYFSSPVLEARMNRPEIEVYDTVGVFPFPLGAGHVQNGSVVSGVGELAAIGKASSDSYFGGSKPAATVYVLSAWEAYQPDDQMDGGEILISIDSFTLQSIVLFALHEGLGISDALDIYLVIDLAMHERLAVSGSMSFLSTLKLLINESVNLGDSAGASRREALQYAVNSITGALSTYQNFEFNQFATVAGRTYAYNAFGLYELGYGSDHGDSISASIDFGASDYGTAQGKRLSSVYAGIATDGEVYIRVAADGGEELIYRAVECGNEARAVTAKGVVARHWRIRLELADASHADLDNIEVDVGVSQRRLRGRR